MLPTSQLPWLYFPLGREGRVVEQPHRGEVVVSSTSYQLVGLHKELWILEVRGVVFNFLPAHNKQPKETETKLQYNV